MRDIVTVKTWVNTLEKSRSVRALEMYVNGKKIVGSTTLGCFNTEKRRPEALALPTSILISIPKENQRTQAFLK
jgi:acyl-CoA thioesterase FadM